MAYGPVRVEIERAQWSRLGYVNVAFMQGEVYLTTLCVKSSELASAALDILNHPRVLCEESVNELRDRVSNPSECVVLHCHVIGDGWCKMHGHTI